MILLIFFTFTFITIKTFNMKEFLYYISLWFNQHMLNCKCEISTSEMMGKGNKERFPGNSNMTQKQILDTVHAKIIFGILGIGIGAFIMQKLNFWVGLIFFMLGLYLIVDVSLDWKSGFKKHHQIHPQH